MAAHIARSLLVLPVFLAGCVSLPSTPAPPVTWRGILLRRKLVPGTQHIYTFNSGMTEKTITDRQELDFQLGMFAEACETVIDYDPEQDVALLGLIGESRWRIKRGKTGDGDPPVNQVWCAAYRVDSRGNSPRKQAGKVPANLVRLHREIGQLSQSSQVCAPFPKKRVRVGKEWEGLVLLPLAGMRLPRKATSRIERMYEEDGKRMCVIKSRISLGGRDFYIGWKPGVCLPDMDVRGSSEGVFDIDDGVWRGMQWDLAITFDGRGFSGKRWVTSRIELLRSRQRSGPVIEQIEKRTRTFDRAIDRLYACDLKGGIDILEKDPGDLGWAKAFELTANLARSFLDPSAGEKGRSVTGLPMPEGADRDSLALYREAGKLSKAGDIDKAIAAYEKFLALSAEDPVVPARVRLLARYRSAGLLEKTGKVGAADAAYKAVLTMKGEDDYSKKLKARVRERLAADNGSD
ncbi:hypothetical protein ACFLQU_00700 [Verrucomicrobiota bacterium]